MRRRISMLLWSLWVLCGVPLAMQPAFLVFAEVEACAMACGLQEGRGCCCQKKGMEGASCSLHPPAGHGGHQAGHGDHQAADDRPGERLPAWDRYFRRCAASGPALGASRPSLTPSLGLATRSLPAPRPAGRLETRPPDLARSQDQRPGVFPRPPPRV